MERISVWKLIFILLFVQIFTVLGICFVENEAIAIRIYNASVDGVVSNVCESVSLDNAERRNGSMTAKYDYEVHYTVDDSDYTLRVKMSPDKKRAGEVVTVHYVSDSPAKSVLSVSDDDSVRIGWIIIIISGVLSLFLLMSIVNIMSVYIKREIKRYRKSLKQRDMK